MSEPELIGVKYYLIDEEKCLYKKVGDNGIIYREKGRKGFFLRVNPRSKDDNSAWGGPPVAFTRSK